MDGFQCDAFQQDAFQMIPCGVPMVRHWRIVEKDFIDEDEEILLLIHAGLL
jgi:hypothetical protein